MRHAREARGVTFAQAQRDTRIRKGYLEAIEQEEWSVFTSRVYITGVIRTYAQYLEVPEHKALAYFRRDYEKNEEITFKKKLPTLSFLPETKRAIYGGIAMVALLFFLYFGYQIYLFQSPPRVSILQPTTRVFRNIDKVLLIGKTEKESVITILNEELYSDKDGVFRYTFPLSKGPNTIAIEVTGPNGKKTLLSEVFILE